eukprot:GHVS01049213.1.p1 GENE.GHVS01049213.1~~GHVS01049213.1.p1  ORF type:complete len:117 (+),score=7.93 GHVS01049213.1:96-446(+)
MCTCAHVYIAWTRSSSCTLFGYTMMIWTYGCVSCLCVSAPLIYCKQLCVDFLLGAHDMRFSVHRRGVPAKWCCCMKCQYMPNEAATTTCVSVCMCAHICCMYMCAYTTICSIIISA